MLRKFASYAGGAVALVLFVALALHAFSPWVPPMQEVPPNHVDGACWACHVVTASAEEIDVDE